MGIVGLGNMGKNHLKVLTKMQNVQEIVVYDSNLDKTEEVRKSFNCNVSGSWEEFENSIDSFSYVVLAVPTFLHFEFAKALIKSGASVLIEKPITQTVQQASELIELISSSSQVVGAGQTERFNSAIREAGALLRSKAHGSVLEIYTRRWSGFPARISDVGVTFDLGSHDIDIVRFLLADDYQEIYATLFSSDKGNLLDSSMNMVGKSVGGVRIVNSVSWHSKRKLREIVVHCEDAEIVIDTLLAQVTVIRPSARTSGYSDILHLSGERVGIRTNMDFPRVEPLMTEHQEFQKKMNGLEDAQVVSLEDAINTIKVLQCAAISSASNRLVQVWS